MGMQFAVTFRGDHVHVELNAEAEIDSDLPTEYWAMLPKTRGEHDTERVHVEGVAPGTELGPAEVGEAGKRTAVVPNLCSHFISRITRRPAERIVRNDRCFEVGFA